MSERKTIARISVITDTDNGYDRIGEVDGSFGYPPTELKEHIRKYGHSEVLETLAHMTSQVMECVRELRMEEHGPDTSHYEFKPPTFSAGELTKYQTEIMARLREKFTDLKIDIGRGDRLMVNDEVIKGFVVVDSRNRQNYEADSKEFSNEIKLQYLDKRKY